MNPCTLQGLGRGLLNEPSDTVGIINTLSSFKAKFVLGEKK